MVAGARARRPLELALRRSREAFDGLQGALDLGLVERDVLELAGEVVVVRGHVEVTVAREVEQDGALLARLVGRLCDLQRPVDRVGSLGRRQDPLRSGEQTAEANTSLWRYASARMSPSRTSCEISGATP